MKKVSVHLPVELHEALRELAVRRKTSLSRLVQRAIGKTYEEELDGLLMEGEVDEYLRDPPSALSLQEYLKRRSEASQ